jgi:hypothetical protein
MGRGLFQEFNLMQLCDHAPVGMAQASSNAWVKRWYGLLVQNHANFLLEATLGLDNFKFCFHCWNQGKFINNQMKSRPMLRSGRYCRITLTLIGVLVTVCGTAYSQIEYSSDFESLDATSSSALVNASWTAYANVFTSGGAYLYGYSATPPNGGSGFWGVTVDQAGPEQGVQSLSVYSDYYNQSAQVAGQLVEANVFQQFPIFLEDVGTYEFRFDAKAGNLEAPSKAQAFIKVLDPSAGYSTVAMVSFDTSSLPVIWGRYSIQLTLDESMEDMILQFGFSAISSLNVASGVFYDNVSFGIAPPAPPTFPVITQITKSGPVVSVTFPSETGFGYHLVKSTDGMASFVRVESQPQILGDGTFKVAIDDAATEPAAFYRIGRQQATD